MSAPWSPSAEEGARHHELAHLALLDHQLALQEQAFADAHTGNDANLPARDQARSMVGVMRLLRGQIEAYRKLLALPATPATPSKSRRR